MDGENNKETLLKFMIWGYTYFWVDTHIANQIGIKGHRFRQLCPLHLLSACFLEVSQKLPGSDQEKQNTGVHGISLAYLIPGFLTA